MRLMPFSFSGSFLPLKQTKDVRKGVFSVRHRYFCVRHGYF